MIHSFDTQIAKKYGIPSAVLIHSIAYWIEHNAANGENYHDGKFWTYNSREAFAVIHDYLSKYQIRRTLDKLVDQNVLMKGTFNKSAYDRTLWYTFTDEAEVMLAEAGYRHFKEKVAKSDGEKCQIHLAKLPNDNWQKCQMTIGKIATPIPNTNQYIYTDNKHIYKDDLAESQKKPTKRMDLTIVLESIEDDSLRELYKDYIEMRKSIKKPMTERALQMLIGKVNKLEPNSIERQKQLLENATISNWLSVYPLKGGESGDTRRGTENGAGANERMYREGEWTSGEEWIKQFDS